MFLTYAWETAAVSPNISACTGADLASGTFHAGAVCPAGMPSLVRGLNRLVALKTR